MEKKRLKYLFQQYYTGAGSPEEKEEFLKLIADGSYATQIEALLFREIRQEKGTFSLTPEEIAELKENVYASTLAGQPAAPAAESKRVSLRDRLSFRNGYPLRGKLPSSRIYYYAAAFLVLIGAATFYWFMQRTGEPASVIRLSTAHGERRHLVLPDGSSVWMNSLSAISYPAMFEPDKRTVEVSGEIYFEIKRDPRQFFVVKAGDVSIHVLGTRFLLSAYKEEPEIEISLMEGNIGVEQSGHTVNLKPGEQITLVNRTSPRASVDSLRSQPAFGQISRFRKEGLLAWRNGDFEFDNTELSAALRRLARWYGFQPEYPEGIPPKQISGKMQQSMPLNEVLQVLHAMKVNCRLQGDKLIVTP